MASWGRARDGKMGEVASNRSGQEGSPPLPKRAGMETMDRWDVAILALAGYVAVMALVRLMLRRRDHIVGEFRREMEQERERKAAAEKKEKQRQGFPKVA